MLDFLNRQPAAQILILDDREVRRFVWQYGVLSFHRHYDRDAEGLAAFTNDIPLFEPLPVIIVTDFIEESFRNDSIAHVNPYDRQAILGRRLDHAFRNTPYRTARITGREQQGRRDDNILLSAITKPSLLQPWLDPLLTHQLHIQSITSTAYLLENYVQHSGRDDIDNLLIVSIDRGLKLRQTFLRRGKVLFSRSTLLSGNDNITMASDIYTESQRIRHYLERIRLLKDESPLQLQVFCLRSQQDLVFTPAPHDHIHPQVINSADEIPPEQVELGPHKPGSIVLFLLEALRKRAINNIYAPFSVRRYHHLRSIARGCYAASALILAGTLLVNISDLVGILDDRQQLSAFQAMARPVNEQYRQMREDLPAQTVPPREMGLIVTNAARIETASSPSGHVLETLSAAISGIDHLQLNDIQWQQIPPARDEDALIARYGYVPESTVDPRAAVQQATLEGGLQIQVRLSGIAGATGSYRAAQNRVLDFINRLESSPTTVSVTPLQMPTDARSDTRVTTTVSDSEVSAPFTLQLTLEENHP